MPDLSNKSDSINAGHENISDQTVAIESPLAVNARLNSSSAQPEILKDDFVDVTALKSCLEADNRTGTACQLQSHAEEQPKDSLAEALQNLQVSPAFVSALASASAIDPAAAAEQDEKLEMYVRHEVSDWIAKLDEIQRDIYSKSSSPYSSMFIYKLRSETYSELAEVLAENQPSSEMPKRTKRRVHRACINTFLHLIEASPPYPFDPDLSFPQVLQYYAENPDKRSWDALLNEIGRFGSCGPSESIQEYTDRCALEYSVIWRRSVTDEFHNDEFLLSIMLWNGSRVHHKHDIMPYYAAYRTAARSFKTFEDIVDFLCQNLQLTRKPARKRNARAKHGRYSYYP